MRKVKVNLAENSYDIFIGENLENAFSKLITTAKFSAKVLVISDENVGKVYGPKLMQLLNKEGLTAELYLVEAGEHSKSLEVAEKIYSKAITMGLDRKSAIFALGGGVVGDLAGFIAATYLRGVPFVQLPTSLLAQVDSSVGGKVAVNHTLGKNLIGAFYQPKAVFIDLAMLNSLPKREIYTGLAEIIKYGIIYDKEFFTYLDQHVEEILALDKTVMKHVIARACEIKAEVVSQDEKEAGLRIILNFGHTIAHAIESETGYKLYNHGEAVAIGMHGAAKLSLYLGLITAETVEKIITLIEKFKLPLKAKNCSAQGLYKILYRDKKVVNGMVQWVLVESIGKVKVEKNVPDEIVRKVLEEVID